MSLGIKELTYHLLALAEEKLHKIPTLDFEKVVFLALAECHNHQIQVNYDMLFFKSKSGATSDNVQRLLGDVFDLYISFERAKKHDKLAQHKELNITFEKLLMNHESLETVIKESSVFQNSAYNQLKTSHIEEKFGRAILDRDFIWTLKEIVSVVSDELPKDLNTRIPLPEVTYQAIKGYISLTRSLEENKDIPFTLKQVEALRNVSDGLIEAVKVNGSMIEDSLT